MIFSYCVRFVGSSLRLPYGAQGDESLPDLRRVADLSGDL